MLGSFPVFVPREEVCGEQDRDSSITGQYSCCAWDGVICRDALSIVLELRRLRVVRDGLCFFPSRGRLLRLRY
jgi:hypothetical protein